MAGGNIYENTMPFGAHETPLKEAGPRRRHLGVPVALASLALLLAVSLVAVASLYFQKEKRLMELEGALQEARSSLWRSGVSYGSEEAMEGLGFLKNISGAFLEIQGRVEEANASRAAAQERLRDLRGLVSGGWTFFGGSAYFFLQEAQSWTDAEQSCRSRGAHLTSVTSQGEMTPAPCSTYTFPVRHPLTSSSTIKPLLSTNPAAPFATVRGADLLDRPDGPGEGGRLDLGRRHHVRPGSQPLGPKGAGQLVGGPREPGGLRPRLQPVE
nr:PREDICTED: C-type lectin domain family 4 member K [Anolis carolinensis]|eukprot:XP_008119458.1 PREDICTED: C-type lectin domain family 4 member K [Anolis carolinensis]